MVYEAGSHNVTPIRLRQLDAFNALKNKLLEIAPVSIDAFLRDHPSYADTGKIMIIYSLLRRELKSGFQLTHNDNWLSYFIDEMANGNSHQDLLENQLSIVTFNYDVSLEYCIHSKLRTFERFQANGIAEQFIKNLPIHHVYGQLYQDNFVTEYGKFYNNGVSDMELQTKCLIKAIKSKDFIKLMGEERTIENNCIKEAIQNAKTIVVMGFGFDPANLVRLGFPVTRDEMIEFMRNKTLKYLNFNGENKSLDTELMPLNNKENNTVIISSKSNSISDAYINSFRSYFL